MNRRLNKLSRALGLPPAPPPFPADAERVRRGVRAALTAHERERKLYMRQKLRFAAVLAAVVIALCGTALAVGSNWDVLHAWFEGDTSPADSLVDREVRSVSDRNYTFTVDSSVSDGQTAFLLIRIDALSEAGRAQLFAEDFEGIDTFSIYPLVEEPETGDLVHPSSSSTGMREMKEVRTDTSRTWRVDVSLPKTETAVAVHARLGYMDKGLAVEVPLTPAEAVEITVGATGRGYPNMYNTYGSSATLERAVVSPFTLALDVSWPEGQDDPPILPVVFRMADGTLRSFCQLTDGTARGGGWSGNVRRSTFTYNFRAVQDLKNLSGIVVWGKEYPLDGGAPRDVEVDEHLLPFTISLMPGLSDDNPYSISVRELCDGLGASCVWDNAAKTATLAYRGSTVVLTWGSKLALVDGEAGDLRPAPDARDGKLGSDGSLPDLWDFYLLSPFNADHTDRTCFLVIP